MFILIWILILVWYLMQSFHSIYLLLNSLWLLLRNLRNLNMRNLWSNWFRLYYFNLRYMRNWNNSWNNFYLWNWWNYYSGNYLYLWCSRNCWNYFYLRYWFNWEGYNMFFIPAIWNCCLSLNWLNWNLTRSSLRWNLLNSLYCRCNNYWWRINNFV